MNPNPETTEDPNKAREASAWHSRPPICKSVCLSSRHMFQGVVSAFSKFYMHAFSKDRVEKEAKIAFRNIIKHDKQKYIKILQVNINRTFPPISSK